MVKISTEAEYWITTNTHLATSTKFSILRIESTSNFRANLYLELLIYKTKRLNLFEWFCPRFHLYIYKWTTTATATAMTETTIPANGCDFAWGFQIGAHFIRNDTWIFQLRMLIDWKYLSMFRYLVWPKSVNLIIFTILDTRETQARNSQRFISSSSLQLIIRLKWPNLVNSKYRSLFTEQR